MRKWGRVRLTVPFLLTDRVQTSMRSQMRFTMLMSQIKKRTTTDGSLGQFLANNSIKFQ